MSKRLPAMSQKIDTIILQLLSERGGGKSICPSEVARRLDETNWRARMDEVREAARLLARKGKVTVTQKETSLCPDAEWRGPIRIRLKD